MSSVALETGHAQREEQSGEHQTSLTHSNDSPLEADLDQRRSVFRSSSGLFFKIFAKAVVLQVDPLRCISVKPLRSKPICRWGVKKINQSILGRSTSQTFINGFVSTGKFSVIAEIPEKHHELVVNHFVENGETPENAHDLAASGKWYHTVEGSHVHAALVECEHQFSEKFAGFRWPVLQIAWQSPETLKAIGRMCNEMHKEEHVIDFPLPDAMQSLRNIIDTHSRRNGIAIIPGERIKPGFIKEAIAIYAGRQGYSCNTLRAVCGSLLKMTSSFVASMCALLTEECEDFWRTLGAKRPFGDDTRVFKKLISTQSLKHATIFLDSKRITDEDRVNVIHRLRFLAKEKESFKAFNLTGIETQAHCVLAARKEVTKFDNFLGDEPWPSEIENLKRNMLATTLFDDVVKEHAGGVQEFLPAIVSAYLRATGAHGSQKLGQYQRMLELEKNSDGDEVISTSACRRSRMISNEGAEILDESEGHTMYNDANGNAVSQEGTKDARIDDQQVSERVEEDPDDTLREVGVELSIATLLEYERRSSEIGGSIDFIIANPFQKVGTDPAENDKSSQGGKNSRVLGELVDKRGVTMYLQSVRRLLKRGGYLFVFLDWSKLQLWKNCCTESQFDIVCDPFLVMKDATRAQKMTLKGQQSVYEPALVLRKPGQHPDGFEMDKSSPYVHLPSCTMPRWCNVIDGVPPPAQRITFKPSRAQVRPSEKPCSLFIEILTTFCPPSGRVLDPFAGTLTTGLACMATDRRCILLETDEKCISYAKERAFDFAKSRLVALSQNLNNGNDRGDADAEETTEDSRNEETESEVEAEDNEAVARQDTNIARNVYNGTAERETTPDGADSPEDPCQDEQVISSRPISAEQPLLEYPPRPQGSKQLSYLSSSELTAEDRNFLENAGDTAVNSSVSTPTVKKRNRNIRSPAAIRTAIVENSTPSAYRRSKRSRKTTLRYND